MISSLLPRIRIHCWGGFGSQLNALAVAYDLIQRFPRRKIEVVIRTGGIHNAEFELVGLELNEFNITEKKIPSEIRGAVILGSEDKISRLKLIIKFWLDKFGFYATCDSRDSFNSVKPWVVTIRGSYNYLPSRDFINYLINKLQIEKFDSFANHNVVHYRLGDLITLNSKSPMDEGLILDQMKKCVDFANNNSFIIMSSDPDVAYKKISNLEQSFIVTSIFVNAPDVLRFGVNGVTFIGTNSKMSLWVVILRIHLKIQASFLPNEFRSNFNQSKINDFCESYIKFY
jgi:hypothetical protein